MNDFNLNYSFAEFLVRSFLGILFIFQGYDKLFIVKLKNVVTTFQVESEKKNIPKFLVVAVSYFTSVTEFFGGFLLILGLFHLIIPIILGINLIVVGVAFSFLNPIWDLKHVFPRLLLLVLVFLLSNYFYFGIDSIIF